MRGLTMGWRGVSVKSIADMNERDSNEAIDLLSRIRKHRDDVNTNNTAIRQLHNDNWDLEMSISKLKERIEYLQGKGSDE